MFSFEFFEIIKEAFFIKHLHAAASECWMLEFLYGCWWKLPEDKLFEVSHFEW